MPNVNRGGAKTSLDPYEVKRANFKYSYPEGLNLKPFSLKHDKLRDMVVDRATESRQVMTARFKEWRKIDMSMTGYITADDAELKVQADDPRKPIAIVVPTSYANHQVLLTYHTAALLSEMIFKYEGIGPEDIAKAIIMEHLIDIQARRSKMLLNLHTMASDAYKYNIGICALEWIVKKSGGRKVVRSIEADLLTRASTVEESLPGRVLYEGNRLLSIDPYEYLPDPHFEAHDVQSMENVGWIYRTNYFKLLKEEQANPGDYFNVRFIEFMDGTSQLYREGRDERSKKTKLDRKSDSTIFAKPVDVLVQLVDLIPSQWDLGQGEFPETWLFKIAGDELIIDAGPIQLEHGMKPVVACSPDFDGHSVISTSRMELGQPLQHAINWLYNSHITNVRKAVNNMLVVDPGLANFNDVTDTRAGAVIRMRKSVWGLGRIKDAVMQLPINDVTRNNMNDVSALMNIDDRVSGAQDAVSGLISQKKERISSFESRQAATSAISRLEKDSRIMYVQAYYDLAYMMAFHTIQLMEEDTYVNITGRLLQDLPKEYNVDRERVAVKSELFNNFRFDVIPHDGSIPGSHGDPVALNQFFATITRDPSIAQAFDIIKLTKVIGRELGIKNVDDFVNKGGGAVLPDEVVDEQANAGNLVSIPELGGANGGV